jgi:secreted PhoX family phosphatase
MQLSRRGLLAGLAVSSAFAGFARAQEQDAAAPTYRNEVAGYGPLVEDPRRVFDLPAGFSYEIVAQAGETMNDGFYMPQKFDGMGCLPLGGGRVALVRNHELKILDHDRDAFGLGSHLADRIARDKVYDWTDDGRPFGGGTTTTVYDLKTRKVERQHLSLAGTLVNCAGGVTPWGSWLSCEETTVAAGLQVQKDHGWVFEVPANAAGLVDPVPIKGLGRFRHEAACIDPRTGIVYLTEDVVDGLFYRFLPNDRTDLHKGGRLQALSLRDRTDTRNFEADDLAKGAWVEARWIDLDGVDNPHDDLRRRGHEAGAALFARGEGVFFGNGELYFTCTNGGRAQLGQIMRYVPGEADQGGRLQLFQESADSAVISYADNLVVAPHGHLVVCEDRAEDTINHLKGVTPDGRVYTLGRNMTGDTELAGACFSPDGKVLFVNLYEPGATLAIRGPWARLA